MFFVLLFMHMIIVYSILNFIPPLTINFKCEPLHSTNTKLFNNIYSPDLKKFLYYLKFSFKSEALMYIMKNNNLFNELIKLIRFWYARKKMGICLIHYRFFWTLLKRIHPFDFLLCYLARSSIDPISSSHILQEIELNSNSTLLSFEIQFCKFLLSQQQIFWSWTRKAFWCHFRFLYIV